ncbi:hemerythrin domain-containing protein [Saccharolobus islandicus]|uniref:Hemerythrin HHE cation binding domain protein n=1 Tax=Saccharolobus islandicus (strain L.D.8.5 / Lassen \|nr:hemerythrin domain-containing protein [Sulfolobus islandicus]ADB86410.1 Hemerythrin HHE cation binding domain protein [Sulfolobus islandicus L.D.8.5]
MLSLILTLDHRRIEELVNIFINNPSIDVYNEIRRSYINHIYWEEEFLFKEVQDSSSLLPIIKSLEIEHGSMWIILDEIKTSDGGAMREKMESFMRILLEHDGAEEGSVYQYLESLTEEKQAKLILEEIKIATPPASWKCKALS